jgi:hypothetical protein
MSTRPSAVDPQAVKADASEARNGFRKIGISAVVAAVEAGGHSKSRQMSAGQTQTDIVSRKLAQMGSED